MSKLVLQMYGSKDDMRTFVWCSSRGSSESGSLSGIVKVWTYITSRELEVRSVDSVIVIDALSLDIFLSKHGDYGLCVTCKAASWRK